MTAAAAAALPPHCAGSRRPARLMIVDDSAIARAVLTRMLSGASEFEVVATAASAAEASALLGRTEVDIVLLDLEMPGGSGLDVLPAIVRGGRGPRVLVVSSSTERGSEAAVRALASGAADTLAKPGVEAFAGSFSKTLAERLRRLLPPPDEPDEGPICPVIRPAGAGKIGCLAIGASTGGLHAIASFLEALPRRIGAPLLVTQHLPTDFIPLFARQIEAACGRPVRIGEDGLLLKADEVVVAPGDAHLGLDRAGSFVRIALSREIAASGCTPSLDVMLTAVARLYGGSGVGIVLSGMGRDGLSGARRLSAAGGRILAQDAATSAVWGMPGAVARHGLACKIAAPAELARQVGAWAEVSE